MAKFAFPFGHGQQHAPGGADGTYADGGHTGGIFLPSFPESDMQVTGTAAASGSVYLSYITPGANLLINYIVIHTAATASSASGQTLIKSGVYSIDNSAQATLIGSSANLQAAGANLIGSAPATNVAAFQVVNQMYQMPLSAGVTLVRGTRYAYATIIVQSGANTLPTFKVGGAGTISANIVPVKKSGIITAQTDLPAGPIAVGGTGIWYWQGGMA